MLFLYVESWCLSSECVAGVMPQLLEESSGRTAYQPSVRILKRDRAADATSPANQLVNIITTVLMSSVRVSHCSVALHK